MIDKSESNSLEQRTVLQGESAEWLKQHQFRLTASNFGKVNSRIQRPSESMQKSVFCPKDLSNVQAISHGKGKEKIARTIYARKMQQQDQVLQYLMLTSLFTQNFLILVQPQMEVFDPSSSSKFGWLVIKCPYSKRGDTLDQASSDPEKVRADFFFPRKPISIMLKYKGSWPSLGYHGVIFVYICQTVMKCVLTELILILNTGKMSCCPN